MDLQIKDQLFVVCGATSGFGKATAEALVTEGAKIIAVARGEEKLTALQKTAPAQIEILAGDISESNVIKRVIGLIGSRKLSGILINAGGPPAKTVMETTLEDWDNAYKSLLRWKVELTQSIVPFMVNAGYGRIVFIESASVKQPLENLVLSNSLRVAVVNMAKTLSQEIARKGVTINILAPGSHNTPAIDRIIKKKSEQENISFEEAKKKAVANMPVGFFGEAEDFASLAVWLLSPQSKFITGQTFSVDGGAVRGIFG